jgi:hypothetical protein
MSCPHMAALKARIADLRAKFVDVHIAAERADPLTYVADTDDLAAFRLLAHAELEEYLEAKAKDGLQAMQAAFAAGRTSVRDNHGVLVIARALKTELRFEAAHWPADVRATLRAANDWIAENNGIKDASFTTLSVLSGKMPDEVDGGLSASLSTYGVARGDVAHRSVARVRTIYAPSDEAKTVDALIVALERYFAPPQEVTSPPPKRRMLLRIKKRPASVPPVKASARTFGK